MATQNNIDTGKPVEVSKGALGGATLVAYTPVCGGTTSTAAVQSVVSIGSSTQVLASAGAGALPTFANLVTGTASPGKEVVYNSAGVWEVMDYRKYTLLYEEFYYYLNFTEVWPWQKASSGTVADAQMVLSESAHLGIVGLTTGTTSTGKAALFRGNELDTGDDFIRFEALVRFPTLSDGSQTYFSLIGINDQTTSSAVNDGIYFEYRHTNSTNWRGCCMSGGALTRSAGTNVSVSANTWYYLVFEVNTAASSVSFSVNGTNIGSVTGNIPGTAGRINLYQEKTVGSTDRLMHVDMVKFYSEFGTNRYT